MAEEKSPADPTLEQMRGVAKSGVTTTTTKAPAAQENKAHPTGFLDNVDELAKKAGTEQPQGEFTWTRGMAMTMGWSLLAFTAIIVTLATLLLWKRNVSGVQIVRLFLLTLIVSLSCFLVVVGYSNAQLTPVIGLFGAICGYLLGKENRTAPEKNGETPAAASTETESS